MKIKNLFDKAVDSLIYWYNVSMYFWTVDGQQGEAKQQICGGKPGVAEQQIYA